MNLEQLKQKVVEMKEEIERLEKQQKVGRWKPVDGEKYWTVTSCGIVDCCTWCNDEYSNKRWSIGNVYQTRELADQDVKRQIIRTELSDLALELNDGIEIDWNDNKQCKYLIGYSRKKSRLGLDYNTTLHIQDTVYCISPDFLEVAVGRIGGDRLKKLFEV